MVFVEAAPFQTINWKYYTNINLGYDVFDSSKKRTKDTPDSIQDFIICFRDLLTFYEVLYGPE